MIRRGDIVLLPYPFTDLSGQKARPALVVSSDKFNQNNQDAIFLFITKTDYKSPFDLRVDITDPRFKTTGLKAASTFRTSKIMTLQKSLARVRIGRAETSLMGDIELRLKSLLQLC